jgi:hypothetical protein
MKYLARAGATVLVAMGAVTLVASPTFATPTSIIPTQNEAGYTATSPVPISSFGENLNVPTVTCPATGNVQLVSEIFLQQTTTTEDGLIGWNETCTNGTLNPLYAFADVGGANASINISPGDELRLSGTEPTPNGAVTLKLSDSNNNLGATVTAVSPSFTTVSALTFVSNGGSGNITPIPTFTRINFGSLKVNGATLTALSPEEFEMFDGATLQVATTSIGSAGTFSTIFKHV